MAKDEKGSIYTTFEKISDTVDPSKPEPQTEKKNPLQKNRKFYHCSFKGFLDFILIYILIYIYIHFHVCKTKLNLTH